MRHLARTVRKHSPLFFALIIILSAYATSLRTGYFADDFDYVVRMRMDAPSFFNLATNNTDGTRVGGSWRPLTSMSYALTMSYGQGPIFNHAISLALYGAILIALYGCIQKIFVAYGSRYAALIVFVIGLMPIHAEPVVWIAARADLLAALFGVSALYAWLAKWRWASILCLALSLLSKEVWIFFGFAMILFSPGISETRRERIRWCITLFVATSAWFIARFLVTRYTIRGYSITDGQNVFGIRHIANEIISFFFGSWNFGILQSGLVRFAQLHWYIFLALVCGLAVYACIKFKNDRRFVFLSSMFVSLLAPIIMLGVPFVRPESSVAEQRYWFAPSIFFALLFFQAIGRLRIKFHYAIITIFVIGGLIGTRFNVALYASAAKYRDTILSGWQKNGRSDATVFLLPDSWYGVHLFASPFFERALAFNQLPQPREVSLWYQWCTRFCENSPIKFSSVARGRELRAVDPRIFSAGSHGLRYDIIVPNVGAATSSTHLYWTGATWTEGVENAKPK